MAGRCVICEGRIVAGRCQECGMDYSRMAEHKYRLNEDCGTYSSEAREQKRSYERTLQGKDEKNAGQKGGYGQKAQWKKAKSGSAGRRPFSVIKWIVAVWMVFGVFGFLAELVTELPGWFPDLGKRAEQAADWLEEKTGIEVEIGDNSEENPDFESFENEARSTEGLYDYVENEMPEDGETWSASLTAGFYLVGETIPQGTYQVSVPEGKGSLHVEDEDNAIWYYSWLEPGNQVEDLRLYPGARVTVEGGCELEFYAENAQTEELVPYVADGSPEEVEVFADEAYLVGMDIAPGRYDVRYGPNGDSGIVDLRVEAEDGDTRMIFLSNYGPEEGYRDVYHNLTLVEGETVVLEGTLEEDMVVLSPELEIP